MSKETAAPVKKAGEVRSKWILPPDTPTGPASVRGGAISSKTSKNDGAQRSFFESSVPNPKMVEVKQEMLEASNTTATTSGGGSVSKQYTTFRQPRLMPAGEDDDDIDEEVGGLDMWD